MLLERAGTNYLLVEARHELGGRVRTLRLADPETYLDVGPAWIWPHQPTVLGLLRRMDLPVFEQFSRGRLVYEDARGSVAQHAMATMGGSLRVEGGLVRLVESMAGSLDPTRVRTNTRLVGLTRDKDGVVARFGDQSLLRARQVVLALPPRVIAATVEFRPTLAEREVRALATVPTWMAGHAKALAVYPEPFWRTEGLNGDGVSHRGPLGELHDASPHDASTGALFGFFGVSAHARRSSREGLEDRVRAQLGRLYGPRAAEPLTLKIVDWADDPLVATGADLVPPRSHPDYRPLPPLTGDWSGVVQLASTEVAPAEGGFVEGALTAAEAMAEALAGTRGHA